MKLEKKQPGKLASNPESDLPFFSD